MLDLEQKISVWRDQMSRGRLSSEALDELESHLRDDFTQQLRSGLDAQSAFDSATELLGCAASLQKEFKKNRSLSHLAARAKNAMLSFAGIPNHHLYMTEPSLKLDSRWTTYLRSAAFLAPAICVWFLGITYVVPEFNSIWQGTWPKIGNYPDSGSGIDQLLRLVLDGMYLCRDHLVFIAAFATLILALLEWRSRRWPRYRRAVIGSGVFLVNLAILFSFGIMFIAATLAGRALISHVKP